MAASYHEYFVKSRKACHREERSVSLPRIIGEAILKKLQLLADIQIASLRSQ